jgi:hypothetical protein
VPSAFIGRWHRETAKVEQIDKIGIRAEAAVELHRIRHHLFHGVGRGYGWEQQGIDRAEDEVLDARKSSS